MIEMTINYAEYNINISEENKIIIENSTLLKNICMILKKFFRNEMFPSNSIFSCLNEIIFDQEEKFDNPLNLIYLNITNFNFFNLSLTNLSETLYYSFFLFKSNNFLVQLDLIILIHNFYCEYFENFLQNLHENKPIYILLKNLEFRKLEEERFDKSMLKRKILLKFQSSLLFTNFQNFDKKEEISLNKCSICDFFLNEKFLIEKHKEKYLFYKKFKKSKFFDIDCFKNELSLNNNYSIEQFSLFEKYLNIILMKI